MNEKEQMVKELIDELGGLLLPNESLAIVPGIDGDVISSILDGVSIKQTRLTVECLASRIKSSEEKKNESQTG